MEALIIRRKSRWLKALYYFHLKNSARVCIKNRGFNFDLFNDEECLEMFRFNKQDILQLNNLLKMPVKITCSNGATVTGIQGICIFLRRLTYPNRLQDLQKLFNLDWTIISRVIKFVLNHIYENFQHLLTGFDKNWISQVSLMRFCDAVKRKGSPLSHCWGFIDGTVRPMCRPSINQRQAYNGHKRVHALKYQSIVAANGLIVDLFGPIEGRRHDAYMLSQSNVMDNLKNLKSPNGEQLCIYGDPAYPLRPQLMGPYKGSQLSPQEELFNKNMSKVRICVEWTFGKIITLFPFLEYKKSQKLYSMPLSKYFKVAAILTNCHTCIYGSQTSKYFQVNPPRVNEYLM